MVQVSHCLLDASTSSGIHYPASPLADRCPSSAASARRRLFGPVIFANLSNDGVSFPHRASDTGVQFQLQHTNVAMIAAGVICDLQLPIPRP